MRMLKTVFAMSIIFLLVSSAAMAGDFDWVRDFNVQAQADPSGFKVRLASRFQMGRTEVNTVISNVESPADAYIVYRLAEISNRPPDYVMKQYKSNGGRGWGVLAKSLGIKPGSKEFHALKRGSDLYDERGEGRGKGKGKGKGKDKW
jgi:hypothetical protein